MDELNERDVEPRELENDEEEEELSDDDNDEDSISESSSTNASQLLDQLRHNDPDLNILCIGNIFRLTEGTSEWERVGLDIGRNTHLELITFQYLHNMSLEDYEALFRGMVQNSSVRDLDFLQSNMLGGRFIPLLTPMFERICQLTFEDCVLGEEGCNLLSDALEGCKKSSLTEVNFDRIAAGISKTGINRIIKALRTHPNLEKISLRGNNIGISGCKELANLLPSRNNVSRLVTLDLGENYIHGGGARLLASGFNYENSTTTHLNLDNNPMDTRGCEAFANLLRSPSSRLKSLSLNSHLVNDEDLALLASSLVNNDTLTDLHLDDTDIGSQGLNTLASVLRSARSRLNFLSLRNNGIKDRGARLLANSLVGNTMLSRLDISGDVTITSQGWKAFSRVLGANRPTIMDTYNANHTLQQLVRDEWTLSGDLMLLLLINRDSDKRDVARKKIVKYHFRRRLDMQLFEEMEVGALPHVIAWMGRDGMALLYQFIRNMQSFFDFGDGVKDNDGPTIKRQRVDVGLCIECPTEYIGDWWHEKPQYE